MIPQWIIEKKRDGTELTAAEIEDFIRGFTEGSIPDYQMAAWAMAVFFRGMTGAETTALTAAMIRTGEKLDTTALPWPTADKHSTGGIGDKVSLALAPLAAACGVAVPMISGRGLGITGGTLDKLEAIPGYRTRLATKEFLEVVRRCGCAICGQTERLAPADRKLYALRDVTGTVPSVPLITASILSKKLSEGLQALVLDVKCGCGAFMTTPDQARALALSLLTVARGLGVRTAALITDMDTPLGRTAGNAVEVLETLRVLRGEGPADVAALTVALGAQMLLLAGVESSEPQAREKIERTLAAGQGYDKFVEMVRLQGGDTRALEDPARLPQPGAVAVLKAKQAGCVVAVDAGKIGRACLLLGAGRTKTSDGVDPAAGIAEMVKPGEWVAAGDRLATLQAASSRQTEAALPLAAAAYRIAPEAPAARPLIIEALLK